jgi:hypothetical protein
MKKKNAALWLIAGAAAAGLAYATWLSPNRVPSGYVAVTVAPGASLSPTHPAAGQVAFLLPSGAQWTSASRMDPGGLPPQALGFPNGVAHALYASGVGAGTTFMLAWLDASGASQSAVYTFA